MRRFRDDRGSMIVLLAISMATMLAVAALALDGGTAYAQRRQMQNAADGAAMAGTRALDRYRFPPSGTTPDYTTIASEVSRVATDGGATSVVSCRLINYDQGGTTSDLGPCTSQSAANSAEGVRVVVSQTRNTYFGGVVGLPTVTATASAAASIQLLQTITSPFIVCGNPSLGGYNLLNSDGSLNPSNAALTGEITIHGSQVPDCGAGSQFKGLLNNAISLTTWTDIGTQGNRVGQYRDVTVGVNACPTDGPFDNCDMILPIMYRGNGSGANATAYVTTFAVFHVTAGSTGNSAHTAHYVATASTIASGGSGISTDLDGGAANMLRLIKLVE